MYVCVCVNGGPLILRMCKQQRSVHRYVRVCLRMCVWGPLDFEGAQAPEARAQGGGGYACVCVKGGGGFLCVLVWVGVGRWVSRWIQGAWGTFVSQWVCTLVGLAKIIHLPVYTVWCTYGIFSKRIANTFGHTRCTYTILANPTHWASCSGHWRPPYKCKLLRQPTQRTCAHFARKFKILHKHLKHIRAHTCAHTHTMKAHTHTQTCTHIHNVRL